MCRKTAKWLSVFVVIALLMGIAMAAEKPVDPASPDGILLMQAQALFGTLPDKMPGGETDTKAKAILYQQVAEPTIAGRIYLLCAIAVRGVDGDDRVLLMAVVVKGEVGTVLLQRTAARIVHTEPVHGDRAAQHGQGLGLTRQQRDCAAAGKQGGQDAGQDHQQQPDMRDRSAHQAEIAHVAMTASSVSWMR